jgi:hypothetical protein
MSPELKNHVQELCNYVAMNEWDFIHEEIGNGIEPKDTLLWAALMAEYLMDSRNTIHPAESFREELGMEVSSDGYILNKEEYFS